MDIIEQALERLTRLDEQAGEYRMVQLSPEDVQLFRDALQATKKPSESEHEEFWRELHIARGTDEQLTAQE